MGGVDGSIRCQAPSWGRFRAGDSRGLTGIATLRLVTDPLVVERKCLIGSRRGKRFYFRAGALRGKR